MGSPTPAQGRDRDDAFVALARQGDASAFGLLFDAWADPVYDRIASKGFTTVDAVELETEAFASVHRRLPQQTTPDPFCVLVLRATRQEMAAADSRRVDMGLPVGLYAEDRLTRGTDARTLGADPAVASFLWEAADLLGEQVRDVLDLNRRHHLDAAEVAAVLNEPRAAVDDILRKVDAGYGAVVRAKIVWRQGGPAHDELANSLGQRDRFDTAAVRVVAEHLRGCPACREASQVPIPPIEVFGAIPLAIAPAGFKEGVATELDGVGVPMGGSASFVHPAPPPAPESLARDLDDDGHGIGAIGLAGAGLIGAGAGAAGAGLLGADPAGASDNPAGASESPAGASESLAGADAGGNGADAPDEADAADHHDAPGATAAGLAAAAAMGAGLESGIDGLDSPTGANAGRAANGNGNGNGNGGGAPTTEPLTPYPAYHPEDAPAGGATAAAAAAAVGAAAAMGVTDAPPPLPAKKASPLGGSKKRWILVAVGTVVVVALLAMLLTRGGGKRPDKLNTAASTTTVVTDANGSTIPTYATSTTVGDTLPGATLAPGETPTTAKGGPAPTVKGGGPAPTAATTTTVAPFPNVNLSFVIGGANPIHPNSWDTTISAAPQAIWNVTADQPVTILLSGPNLHTNSASGDVPLCPGSLGGPNGTMCTATPGSYTYTLTVTDRLGRVVRTQTLPLIVNA